MHHIDIYICNSYNIKLIIGICINCDAGFIVRFVTNLINIMDCEKKKKEGEVLNGLLFLFYKFVKITFLIMKAIYYKEDFICLLDEKILKK